NPHPLFYGVYHDLVYHHGASFRDPRCRLEMETIRDRIRSSLPARIQGAVIDRINSCFLRLGSGCFRAAEKLKALHPLSRGLQATIERNRATSREVLDRISEDPAFYARFIQQAVSSREAEGTVA